MMLLDYTIYALCWLIIALLFIMAALFAIALGALVWEILRWLTGHGAADEESC